MWEVGAQGNFWKDHPGHQDDTGQYCSDNRWKFYDSLGNLTGPCRRFWWFPRKWTGRKVILGDVLPNIHQSRWKYTLCREGNWKYRRSWASCPSILNSSKEQNGFISQNFVDWALAWEYPWPPSVNFRFLCQRRYQPVRDHSPLVALSSFLPFAGSGSLMPICSESFYELFN